MFYSHEVLTSRKYGVATVWLVATLGSKSVLKKVSRKAILDVDVTKACETVVGPEAPLALRLQSNLLYGITRVYSQQCGYVLHDAENARNSMRAVVKLIQSTGLEAEGANKGRSDQLILLDDPNFEPDLNLMPIDMDGPNFEMTAFQSSQLESLSPRNSYSASSQYSVGGLIIPPSASSATGGVIGGLDLFNDRDSSALSRRQETARLLEDDDLGIDIGPDGNVQVADRSYRQSDIYARSDRRQETFMEGGSQENHSEHNALPEPDDDYIPAADPFAYRPSDSVMGEDEAHLDASLNTAQAPIRRKKRQAPKIIPLDGTTELRNGDLNRWNDDYLKNMQEAAHHKTITKFASIAKENARRWVLGPTSTLQVPGPLDIFSGVHLIEAFTGVNLLAPSASKRAREGDEVDENGRRVRSRSAEEYGRGLSNEYDFPMPENYDDTIEMGRQGQTPLDDRRMSSLLPWNQSAGSRRPTDQHPTSTSQGGGTAPLSLLHSRRGSRLVSASPLTGRGPASMPQAGLQSDRYSTPLPFPDTLISNDESIDDFEMFGPAAQVDTQTADQSQWQRSALVGESANFLAFVKTAIETAAANDDLPGAAQTEALSGLNRTIDFETLLPPAGNSSIVAAQAFLHVLALGTRNMLRVRQEEDFGSIDLRINDIAAI